MSKHIATTAEAEISPKVKAQAWTGLLITVGITLVSVILLGVTPDMLTALGPWAGPVGAGLAAAGGALAGYLKRDGLREVGGSAVAAGGVVPALPTPAESVGVQTAVPETVATGEVVADVEPEDEVEVTDTSAADALALKAARLK